MKAILMIIVTAMLLATTVYAEQKHKPLDAVDSQLEEVQEQIKSEYIESFCKQMQPPDPQNDQVIIYYERDENGHCVARARQGKAQ